MCHPKFGFAMQATVEQVRAEVPWAKLLGVTAALAVFGAAQGLSYPLFTLLMQEQGMSPGMIGLSAAMMPMGLILSAVLVPAAVRLIGPRKLVVICALSAALCFFLIGGLKNWIAWFPIRFLIGVAINPLFILGEVWALAMSPPEQRGRFMGVFNMIMSVGYAIGPLSLAMVGTQGWPPFIIAISAFCICAMALAFATRGFGGFGPREEEVSGGIIGFARNAPALLLAVTVTAATQQILYSLSPVYGSKFGLGVAVLAGLATALSIGNILLQLPLGLAAERFGARTMMLVSAGVTMLCVLSLPLVISSYAIWPVFIILGGMSYGIYTMTIIELGNRFKGSDLVTGNAVFAMMWGVGGLIGAPGAGGLMEVIGHSGFVIMLASLCILLISFTLYRSWQRSRTVAA